MNSGRLALGVLATAAAGILVGFLFAPAKGAVLRRKIQSVGEKDIDVVKDKFNDFVDTVSKNFEKVKETVVDFTHQTMSRAEEKVKAAEN